MTQRLEERTDRVEGFAGLALAGPLSVILCLVALIQLGAWLPHYLTWPYWADHDVFANAARAWDLGEKPYRDVRQNNFPGTIYLFYLLGKTLGWGKPWTFYALDSTLLLTLVIVLIIWSRKTFGRVLPGLIGSLAYLSYYLSLDYCHTAQRDGQGPCLASLALLISQTWPGRAGRVISAFLASLALVIRPQTILFLPALMLVAAESGDSKRDGLRRGFTWLVTFAVFAVLAFLPLAVNGIFDDFLQALRRVAFGSTYNKVTLASVAKGWLLQASAFRWLVVPAGIVLLSHRGSWRISRPWLIALAGVSLYKPLSPLPHSYLEIPLVLVWAMNAAVLAGLVVSSLEASSTIKLASVIALLGLGTTTIRPEFCVVGPSLRAVTSLRSGVEPEVAPPGYRHGSVATSAYYPWRDYRETLLYLRARTKPSTKVANALKGDPAIVSEVDRPSAFPAESIAWLRMVDPRDEPEFVESLSRATDSVVLWSPGELGPDPLFQTRQIEAAIRRLYVFETRFGAIEVWRRRGEAASL